MNEPTDLARSPLVIEVIVDGKVAAVRTVPVIDLSAHFSPYETEVRSMIDPNEAFIRAIVREMLPEITRAVVQALREGPPQGASPNQAAPSARTAHTPALERDRDRPAG